MAIVLGKIGMSIISNDGVKLKEQIHLKCNLYVKIAIKKKQLRKIKMITFNYNECRPGTLQAIEQAIYKFSVKRNQELSIELPPRYGKAHTARLISLISVEGWKKTKTEIIQPFACANLFLSHTGNLREQIASPDKWEDLMTRFSVEGVLPLYSQLKNVPDNPLGIRPNGEHFLSATIQLVHYNRLLFTDWIRTEAYSSGLPVNVFFDESHFSSLQSEWGQLINKLQSTGWVNFISLTATPMRSDKGIVPAFNAELVETEDIEETVFIQSFFDIKTQKEMVELEHRTGQKHTYSIHADVSIPFRVAWESGYLCKADHQTIDVDLSKIKGLEVEPGFKLSELSLGELKGNLGKIVKSSAFIKMAAQTAIERLEVRRQIDPRASIAIFSEPDTTSKKNDHQKLIQKWLKKLAPNLKGSIATSNSEDDNADYIITNHEKSDDDYVILKAMGGAGWDCGRIKVVLDLSSVRQDASTVQRWTRGATPHLGQLVYDLIIPADAKAIEIYTRLIDQEGGTATQKDIEAAETLVVEKKKKEKTSYVIDGVQLGDFGEISELPINQPSTEIETAQILYGAIPQLSAVITRARIVEQLNGKGIKVSLENPASTKTPILDEEIEVLQDDIIKSLDDYARLAIAAKQFSYPKWENYSSDCYTELKNRACKIYPLTNDYRYESIRKIRSIQVLKILKQQAEIMLDEAENGIFIIYKG